MARGDGEITCQFFIGQADGSYKPYTELSEQERAAFGKRLVARMGEAINNYYAGRPEEAAKLIESLAPMNTEEE